MPIIFVIFVQERYKIMVKNFSDLDLNKSYTYVDYLTWKFKEQIELIKGRIFKMGPVPSYHTDVARLCFESGKSF